MSEYYAVQRSGESLAHYGVKGMQWGVRKAIATGNERALDKHYKKAQKKLAKLNSIADIDKQKDITKKYGKIAKVSSSIGAGAAGLSVGSKYLQKLNGRKYDKKIDDIWRSYYRGNEPRIALTPGIEEALVGSNPLAKKAHDSYRTNSRRLSSAKHITAGIGAVGLGVGAISGARALAAKRHTTTGGHAAAVAKRNEFKREMDKAFKGTKYENGGKPVSKRRKRR